MRAIEILLALSLGFGYKLFYSNIGKVIYLIGYTLYIILQLLIVYLLDAFSNKYMSHILTLEIGLIFVCCIQCG